MERNQFLGNFNDLSCRATLGTNWLSGLPRCVALLIPLLLLAVLTGCDEGEPEAKSKYEVDSSGLTSEGGGVEAKNPEKPWLKGQGQEAINNMLGYAKMLQIRSQRESLPEMVRDLNDLVVIGEDLEAFDLSEEEKVIAFQIKVAALLRLQSLADRKGREKLLAMTLDTINHENYKIQRLARTALIAIRLKDFLRTSDAKIDRLQNRIVETLKLYPDDEVVAKELQALVVTLIGRDRRDAAIEVMKLMKDGYENSSNEILKDLAARLGDRIDLALLEFDKIVVNYKSGARDGEEKFVETIFGFAGDNTIGPEIYDEVIGALRLMEQKHNYGKARQLTKLIAETMSTHENEAIRKRAEEDTRKTSARLDLVGRSLNVAGMMPNGKPFDMKAIEGKVTCVVFWSAERPKSVRALGDLLSFYGRYKDRGFEIVSVCVDKDTEAAKAVFGVQHPPWISVYRNKDDEASAQFFEKTGIQFVPYVMTFDAKGVVRDVNVSMLDMNNTVNMLLMENSSGESNQKQDNLYERSKRRGGLGAIMPPFFRGVVTPVAGPGFRTGRISG